MFIKGWILPTEPTGMLEEVLFFIRAATLPQSITVWSLNHEIDEYTEFRPKLTLSPWASLTLHKT